MNGFVQLLCCHTGVNYLAGMYQSICSDSACLPQFLYIRFGFNGHTHFTPTAFNTRALSDHGFQLALLFVIRLQRFSGLVVHCQTIQHGFGLVILADDGLGTALVADTLNL